MSYSCNNFIGIFKNVYPDGFCEHLINEFERNVNEWGINRKQSDNANSIQKNDTQIHIDGINSKISVFNNISAYELYWQEIQKCFKRYSEDFSFLTNSSISCTSMKLQKTNSGGGYHLFHAEQSSGIGNSRRVLVYMLYLNSLSVEACGETEFLYQQQRIQPEKNTLVIWPASFTHTHRGNPVYGNNSKYISTGWFNYDD